MTEDLRTRLLELVNDPTRHLVRWIDGSHLVDVSDLLDILSATDTEGDDVRLTENEMRDLRAAAKRDEWSGEWNSLPTAVERVLTDRVTQTERWLANARENVEVYHRRTEAAETRADRMAHILSELGFCPKDGDPMPCMTCGAGL